MPDRYVGSDGLEVKCTGYSAGWCPRCGDCTCPDRVEAVDDLRCPLHAPNSEHAEDPATTEP